MAVVNGSTSIMLSWVVPEEVNGIIVRYELTISSNSLGQGNFSISGAAFEFTAMMLSPFTIYTFEVAAVTGAGRGASVTVTDITYEDGKSQPYH